MVDRQAQSDFVRASIEKILSSPGTVDKKLSQIMGGLKDYPLEYVMFNFPWGEGTGIDLVELEPEYKERFPGITHGPDVWACEFLDRLGDEIRAREFTGASVDPIRFSTASGHGIGKSTLVAWLIMFILDTRPYSMGVVTANTSDQLRTKTWAEVAKWHHLAKTTHFWTYSNSRGNMSLKRNGNQAVANKWKCDAMTARAENAEAFQGLHAAGSVPFYIFDEASGIEEAIWNARHGGATDGMPMSFDFGNPTRKSGYFYENTVGKYRHRYITRQIDSRDVKITNKNLFREWQEDWGEDDDRFKVKVMGIFPSAGSVQFISNDLVKAAQARPVVGDKSDPLIIGIDVARFGTNNTVIYPRVGLDARSWEFREYNGLDGPGVAEKVIEMIHQFQLIGKKPAAIFIDGGGLGSSPYDFLVRLGYSPISINFGNAAKDPRYRYMGDQMWGRMRDALNQGLVLPKHEGLYTQLTQREYGIMGSGKINLESKMLMKERLGSDMASPDIADALCLTFAHDPNAYLSVDPLMQQTNTCEWDYDPFKEIG